MREGEESESGRGHVGVALALVIALSGCAAEKTVARAPTPPVLQAVPACPESILPGGDPLESEGYEGKPVVRVCVVGGSEASRKSVERVALLGAGDTFTGDRVRADLDGLMKLGAFDDASAYGLRVQQGASVVVFYSIHDRPLVADIAFEGAKVLGDDALGAKLPVAKGSPYDPVRVNAIAQAVRDEYRARGYEGCRVTLVTQPVAAVGTAPAGVRVRIKVDEGPLWHLTKLDFRGTKKVSVADLRKVAALKVGQPFVQDEIERATLLMSALLYDRGLVQMRIDPEQGPVDPTGGVPLTFVVDEGDVFTIGALHVTKRGKAQEKEILEKVVRARAKQVFSRSALVEDIARIKAFFKKTGQDVAINPQTEVDVTKHVIDVTLEVE